MIEQRIESDYQYVESLGYKVLGVFLQGSQNYGLAYEGSDIDTKCIVLPSFEDFCLNKKPTSTTLVLPSNEHIDLKDIRLMFDCFKKQNVNFVEILFTQYRKLNPEFEELYKPMFENAEAIARYNNYAFINCMAGMSMEKYKALEHPYPTLVEKIEKYGYDPKQLHHIVRMNEFMIRYIDGESYSDCLASKKAEYLIDIKRGCHTLEEARQIAKSMLDDTTRRKNEYMESNPLVINKFVGELINEVLIAKKYKHQVNQRKVSNPTILPANYMDISLGVSMKLPDGYEAHIVPRSSTFKKWGILQTNHMGVIDNSYSGDNDIWGMPVLAMRDTIIQENDRICQFRIVKRMEQVEMEQVDHLEGADRGGFGSTGHN